MGTTKQDSQRGANRAGSGADNKAADKALDAAAEAVAGEVVAEGDPGEFRPGKGELVVRDPSDETQVFRAFDAHDEDLVLQELQGRALDVMVYEFASGDGKMQRGLTVWGVREAVRTLNARGLAKIRTAKEPAPLVEPCDVDGRPHIRVTVYAEDVRNGGGEYGVAEQPVKLKLRSGKEVADPFVYRKALSKAQRNAQSALIPQMFRQVLVAQLAKDDVAVRRIKAGAGAEKIADHPPALDTAEAKALVKRIEGAYRELREVNPAPADLLPAKFNEFLTRSAHAIDRLEAFLEHVEQLRDQEKKAQEAQAA